MRMILFVLFLICGLVLVPLGGTHAATVVASDITLVTQDDIELRGTYYDAGMPGPAVLFVHMCRSDADRNTWSVVANDLANAGIHALAIDLRGYGESSGGEPAFTTMENFISFWRTTGMNDLAAAYEFFQSQDEIDLTAVGFAGASCGVFLGVEFAEKYPNTKALALLSGPFDTTAGEKLSQLKDVPVLGIASEDDGRAYEAMKRVFTATPNPHSRNLQLKGDAHGTDMFEKQPDLRKEMVVWFSKWLKGDSSD